MHNHHFLFITSRIIYTINNTNIINIQTYLIIITLNTTPLSFIHTLLIKVHNHSSSHILLQYPSYHSSHIPLQCSPYILHHGHIIYQSSKHHQYFTHGHFSKSRQTFKYHQSLSIITCSTLRIHPSVSLLILTFSTARSQKFPPPPFLINFDLNHYFLIFETSTCPITLPFSPHHNSRFYIIFNYHFNP